MALGYARILDEFLWALRRQGITISTETALDAMRGILLVGVSDREQFRSALRVLTVKRAEDRVVFERAFEAFFAGAGDDLRTRLRMRGASEEEVEEVLRLIDSLAKEERQTLEVHLGRGAELDHVLAKLGLRPLARAGGETGPLSYRVAYRAKMGEALSGVSGLLVALEEAFGHERAGRLMDLLKSEVLDVQPFIQRSLEALRGAPSESEPRPFRGLSQKERAILVRRVRAWGRRLLSGARVRTRHARQGQVSTSRTMREALRTSGEPLRFLFAKKKIRVPKLVLLCDLSDSVRDVATLALHFVHVAQSLYKSSRSFVFVSDLGEVTHLFSRFAPHEAFALLEAGSVVSTQGNSNYGRVFQGLLTRHAACLTRDTTLVVLGDGRTNYLDDGVRHLCEIEKRVRKVIWLCPDGREAWALGDSRMVRYERYCDAVLEVRSLDDFARATRHMGRR